MATWAEFEAEAPELAAVVRERFTAHKHHTLATLRADGSPRISGTEVQIGGGEMWLGSMAGSRKGQDLRRDPRAALHSHSEEPDTWPGDAKVSGRAVAVDTKAERAAYKAATGVSVGADADVFRLDLREVSAVVPGDPPDHLVVSWWRPGAGVQHVKRR